VKLAAFGLADQTEAINRAAAEIARSAADGKISVVGAIGPLGIRLEPFGPTSREEAEQLFRRQVRGLLDGGVDGFILETFSDEEEIHAALRAVRGLCDLPVVCQMTIGTDGRTQYGTDPATFTKKLTEWGADVIGVNCSVGPTGVLEAVEKMVKVTDRPIAAQPNAGLPKDVGDRKIYLASPEYMASYARRMIEAGARFVGGCCGTTPEHIKKIRDYVASVVPRQATSVV
jgi:homocysteine S-methyltransferase